MRLSFLYVYIITEVNIISYEKSEECMNYSFFVISAQNISFELKSSFSSYYTKTYMYLRENL